MELVKTFDSKLPKTKNYTLDNNLATECFQNIPISLLGVVCALTIIYALLILFIFSLKIKLFLKKKFDRIEYHEMNHLIAVSFLFLMGVISLIDDFNNMFSINRVGCKLQQYFIMIGTVSTSFSLVGWTVARFTVLENIKVMQSKKIVLIEISTIWIIVSIIVIPMLVLWDISNKCDPATCVLLKSTKINRNSYYLALFFIEYIIPVLLMTILYWLMLRKLGKKKREVCFGKIITNQAGESNTSFNTQGISQASKNKTLNESTYSSKISSIIDSPISLFISDNKEKASSKLNDDKKYENQLDVESPNKNYELSSESGEGVPTMEKSIDRNSVLQQNDTKNQSINEEEKIKKIVIQISVFVCLWSPYLILRILYLKGVEVSLIAVNSCEFIFFSYPPANALSNIWYDKDLKNEIKKIFKIK